MTSRFCKILASLPSAQDLLLQLQLCPRDNVALAIPIHFPSVLSSTWHILQSYLSFLTSTICASNTNGGVLRVVHTYSHWFLPQENMEKPWEWDRNWPPLGTLCRPDIEDLLSEVLYPTSSGLYPNFHQFIFFSFFIIVVLGVHCDIYKSSYNIS
jgi:hypothetical protein